MPRIRPNNVCRGVRSEDQESTGLRVRIDVRPGRRGLRDRCDELLDGHVLPVLEKVAQSGKPLLIIVAAITVFRLLLERLGMFITVPVLIIMASFAGDEFSWRGVLASVVVLTIGCWLVFILGLKLTIPLWPRFMQ